MRFRRWISCALLAGLTFWAGPALAKKKAQTTQAAAKTSKAKPSKTAKGKTTTRYRKVTHINMGDGLVDVKLHRPEGTQFRVVSPTSFDSLVRFRKSFNMELFKTAKNL